MTSDPRRMLGRYLTKPIYRTWEEVMTDDDTQETVTVERSELLWKEGTELTQDVLAELRFFVEAGEVKEVEVSNQQRKGVCTTDGYVTPYVVKADVEGKAMNVLTHAAGVENAIEIAKDYLELNVTGLYELESVKRYVDAVVLTDEGNDVYQEGAAAMRWYKINARVTRDCKGEEMVRMGLFLVFAKTAADAERIINDYVRENAADDDKERLSASIEESGMVNVKMYVPREFSDVYTYGEEEGR